MSAGMGVRSVRLESLVCLRPSSGTFQADTVAWAAGIFGSAFGGFGGLLAGIAETGATFGAGSVAVPGFILLGAAGGAALAEALAAAGRAAVSGIGSTLPDQVYIEIDNKHVWPAQSESYKEMNSGDLFSLGVEFPRGRGTMIVKIFDKDPLLDHFAARDVLLEFTIDPSAEYLYAPIAVANEKEGCVYVLFLSATNTRTEAELVKDAHERGIKLDPQTGKFELPKASFEIYRVSPFALQGTQNLPGGPISFASYIERFAGEDLNAAEFYSTISIDEVPNKITQINDGNTIRPLPLTSVIVNGRTQRGVETYRVFGGEWSWMGTCTHFVDGWDEHEYYSTIQTAVVGDQLYLLGKGAGGIVIFRWEDGTWSENLGTCTHFDTSWNHHEYYSTIQTAVVGNQLYLLGKGAGGVVIFRWDGASWSENLGTFAHFDAGWNKYEYYLTIQAAVVGDQLYLLGKGAGGVVIFRWEDGKWSDNLRTCTHFVDGWSKPEYYSTIQTAVVRDQLYLLGKGADGVVIFRWEGGIWSENLGTCTHFDTSWNEPEYYSTIQAAVVSNRLYLVGRGAGGVMVFRWDDTGWSENLVTLTRFADPVGANPRSYGSIRVTPTLVGELLIAGIYPPAALVAP